MLRYHFDEVLRCLNDPEVLDVFTRKKHSDQPIIRRTIIRTVPESNDGSDHLATPPNPKVYTPPRTANTYRRPTTAPENPVHRPTRRPKTPYSQILDLNYRSGRREASLDSSLLSPCTPTTPGTTSLDLSYRATRKSNDASLESAGRRPATAPDLDFGLNFDVEPCRYCGCHFFPDRLAAHEAICARTDKNKRKIFEASKHRPESRTKQRDSRTKRRPEKSKHRSDGSKKRLDKAELETLVRNMLAQGSGKRINRF